MVDFRLLGVDASARRFVLPSVRHSFGPCRATSNWLRGDYFARHLLGHAAGSVDIELNREIEQVGNRERR